MKDNIKLYCLREDCEIKDCQYKRDKTKKYIPCGSIDCKRIRSLVFFGTEEE
jgi:hypothetical protein